jgi:hypothetical protein
LSAGKTIDVVSPQWQSAVDFALLAHCHVEHGGIVFS